MFRFLLLCEVGVGRVVVEQEFRLERSHLRVPVCLCVCVSVSVSVCDQTVDDVQGQRGRILRRAFVRAKVIGTAQNDRLEVG